MRFRLVRAVAALSLVFTGVVATDAVGVRPELIDSPQANIKPVFQPYGLANGMVTFVLQLTGDPVAVRQANAGRDLTDAEIATIEAQLKGQQDRVATSVKALGGTVIASYQSAYNGVKIRISQDKVDQLAALPNVMAVRTLQVMKPDNTKGIPLIGAPTVWQNSGFRGERVKIAIIDTGIDYTHANFGGPGTEAAYEAAHGAEAMPADPNLFGPRGHTRVKGGIDLVGDSYNADSSSADYQPIPHPDSNPLDCNGHGSHVAGTAAGAGVLTGGTTYTGTYDSSTISANSWIIGPGVAPKADLYAVRVFGCEGSTDVTVDAIEWAVKNKMDVINMSLGSVFGSKDDPSAEAATNAVKAGVVVVASAGNSGANQYMTGSPATGDGALSVAASDPSSGNPGAIISGYTGGPATAMNANGHPLTGLTFPMTIKVVRDNPATLDRDESLGCSVADITWEGAVGANTAVVVNRGVCARVAKAIFGQQAGAVVVIMVNNDTVLPPFEGSITSNPDDGTPYTVTIPFLGVKGLPTTATSDGGKLRAANGQSITNIVSTFIANTAFKSLASFSSAGPRTGDSFLKPEITAPGVSTVSTGMGTGSGAAVFSGTSMASPHVAGVAALTRQAHPTWTAEEIKAAIVNTGSPADVAGSAPYKVSRAGTGLVQPVGSTGTKVVAGAAGEKFVNALNFGYVELSADFKNTKVILLTNKGSTAAKFTAAQGNAAGRPHTVSINTGRSSTITVPAGGTVSIPVTLSVPVASVLASNASGLNFREVAGNIVFTPVTGTDNGGIALRVPYYLVPRALSNVSTTTGRLPTTPNPSVAATIKNTGAIAGDADFYAWGLQGTSTAKSTANIRAVGVQSFDWDGTQNFLGFAVNTATRASNPSVNEFDIYVDVDGDGVDDYIVVGVDQGAIQTGTFNGRLGGFVFSTRSGGASINFLAQAPTDSSSAVIFVLTSQLCRSGEPCLNAANPRMTYHAIGFDIANGGSFTVPGKAKFNAWNSAISQGDFVSVAPGGTDTSVHISINNAEWAITPALGSMILSIDNASGVGEAQLIKFSPRM
jgi:minor extracellular serine protease Vpr